MSANASTAPVAAAVAPIALVTGASRGIGRAAAVALARRGVRCVLLARTVGGLEETDDLAQGAGGAPATLLPMDLADGDSIDAIGPTLAQRFGRLDLLVHAAAHPPPLTPVAHLAAGDWDRALSVNLSAGWRLLRTLTPLLLRAPDPRAVLLTGPAAPEPFWGALAATRAALAAMAGSWAAENPAIRLHLFDPGPTATRFRASAFPGENKSHLAAPDTAGERIAALCRE